MSVPEEVLAAVRDAGASRPDVARVVLLEQRVEPLSEEPFDQHTSVLVLDEPPTDAPPAEVVRELTLPFLGAVAGRVQNVSIRVPGAVACATRAGTTIYERDGAA